jgi:hypothetical protein
MYTQTPFDQHSNASRNSLNKLTGFNFHKPPTFYKNINLYSSGFQVLSKQCNSFTSMFWET